MNIYEEAKVITHEEARKELLVLNDKVDRNSFQNEYATLDNYITEQQSKEERAKKVEELFMVSDEIIYIYELPSINIRNTRRLNELKIKLRKIKGELEEMK